MTKSPDAAIIKWNTTKAEAKLIGKINTRARRLMRAQTGKRVPNARLDMDITATHCNGPVCGRWLNPLHPMTVFAFLLAVHYLGWKGFAIWLLISIFED